MPPAPLPRPYVAVIGRPNVGKSTLFNRLVGHRLAIVQDQPGVTRDRNYHAVDYCGTRFTLIDTGGIDPAYGEKRGQAGFSATTADRKTSLSPFLGGGDAMLAQVQRQTDFAIEEADTLIYLMDGREGLTAVDLEIAERLRRVSKPVWYVVNKVDGPKHDDKLYDFYQLGVDRIFPLSAEHGYGLDDLLEAAIPKRGEPTDEPARDETPRVIVLGRPNAGKSTLINTILGEERLVTSEVPGTTRDTIDTLVERRGRIYRFIDTAGIRRRGKVGRGVEHFSVARAQDALARADLALVMIDASEGVVEQETKIAGEVLAAGKGCILVINKWDLKPKGEEAKTEFMIEMTRRFTFLEHAPSLFISALKGAGVGKIFSAIDDVMAAYTKRVTTGDLNRFFDRIMRDHPPPISKSRRVRLYYITQAAIKPPTFVAFSNDAAGLPANYQRYLENSLRKQFGFGGTPIKMVIRMKHGRT